MAGSATGSCHVFCSFRSFLVKGRSPRARPSAWSRVLLALLSGRSRVAWVMIILGGDAPPWEACQGPGGHGAGACAFPPTRWSVPSAAVAVAPCRAWSLLLRHARFGWNLSRPFGHASERATQRLEAENALVLVGRPRRGGARALPRHPQLLQLGRARVERTWAFARAAATIPSIANNRAARIYGPSRVHRSSSSRVAACERHPFSRERQWAATSERG